MSVHTVAALIEIRYRYEPGDVESLTVILNLLGKTKQIVWDNIRSGVLSKERDYYGSDLVVVWSTHQQPLGQIQAPQVLIKISFDWKTWVDRSKVETIESRLISMLELDAPNMTFGLHITSF